MQDHDMPRAPDAAMDDFRERLVPEAFARRFTGHRVEVVPQRERTAEAFHTWVAEMVEHLRTYDYPVGGRPALVAVIEDVDGVRWRWDESPCCERSWFASRLRREVGDIAEPWLLAVDLVPPEPSWEGWDPATGEWEEWLEPRWVDARGQLAYYAEARSQDVALVRAGVLRLVHDTERGREDVVARDEVDPRRHPAVAGYHVVLRGHPARRTHRLQRRR